MIFLNSQITDEC